MAVDGMHTIYVNGEPHSGAYSTKAEAERHLATVRGHFPSPRDVVEVRPHGSPSGFATNDAPGTLGVKPQTGSGAGENLGPSDGMIPGPGGTIITETLPTGQATSQAPKEGTNADLPGTKPSQAPGAKK